MNSHASALIAQGYKGAPMSYSQDSASCTTTRMAADLKLDGYTTQPEDFSSCTL